jgi:hypothetical protein
MRNILVFIVALALCLSLKAGDYSFYTLPPGRVAVYTNVTFSSNSFPAATLVTFTNVQNDAQSLNHTFQWFSFAATNTLAMGTNVITIALDSTIDGANFVNLYSTNMNVGTNAAQFSIIGKYTGFQTRVSVIGTNEAIKQIYMAQ